MLRALAEAQGPNTPIPTMEVEHDPAVKGKAAEPGSLGASPSPAISPARVLEKAT